MKLKVLIIDDEPLARQLLLDFTEKVSFLEVAGTFSSGLAALEYFQKDRADLVFLDIQMPDITGLALLKSIPNPPRVIFTTAYTEYAVEGFELDAVDYLLKPFDFPRFLKAANKALEACGPASRPASTTDEVENFIFVKDGRELVKVYHKDIWYISGKKDYVMFHTPQARLMSLMKMRDLERDLPAEKFLRIHQSYIINKDHIQSVSSDQVKLNGEYLPVSQTYKLAFRNFLAQYKY